MNSTTRLTRVLLASALSVFAIAAVLIVVRRSQNPSPERLFSMGIQRLTAHEYPEAFSYLKRVADLAPSNTNYLWSAAVAGDRSGKKVEGLAYLRKSWDLGLRNLDAVRLLMDLTSFMDRADALRLIIAWMGQLPPTPERTLFEGQVHIRYGNVKDATDLWTRALQIHPDSNIGLQLARTHLSQGALAPAQKVLAQLMSAHQLSDEGFSLLISLSSLSPKDYPSALQLMEEVKKSGHYTDQNQLQHGVLFLLTRQDDQARAVFRSISSPTTNQAAVDIHRSARLFLAYDALIRRKADTLRELAEIPWSLPSAPEVEGEKKFFQGIEASLKRESRSAGLFEEASKLLPAHVVMTILRAEQLARLGQPEQSVRLLDGVRGPMQNWNVLLSTRARACAGAKMYAEALVSLELLRAQNALSRADWLLLREVGVHLNRQDLVGLAQSVLEKAYPNDLETRLFAGYKALNEGNTSGAQRIFSELLARYTDDDRVKGGKVQALLSEGKHAEALDLLSKLKVSEPVASPLRAVLLLRMGDLQTALDSFEKALKHPQPASVHLEYAKALGLAGRAKEATNQFSITLAMEPESVDARLGLTLHAYAHGDLTEARQQARALYANPAARDEHTLLLLAGAEAAQRQWQEAVRYCDGALLANQTSLRARLAKCEFLLQLGQTNAARDGLIAAMRATDDPAPRENLALLLLQSGQASEARPVLEPLLTQNPTNLAYRLAQVQLLGMERRFSEASNLLVRLQTQVPEAVHLSSQAWLLEQEGYTNRAVALLESKAPEDKLIAMHWARLRVQSSQTDTVLGILKHHHLDPPEWLELLRILETSVTPKELLLFAAQARQDAPESLEILTIWARASLDSPDGDVRAVVAALELAHSSAPLDVSILDAYADSLTRSKRYREGVDILEKNRQLLRTTPQLLYRLGGLQEGLKNFSEAANNYRQCEALAVQSRVWPLPVNRMQLASALKRVGAQK